MPRKPQMAPGTDIPTVMVAVRKQSGKKAAYMIWMEDRGYMDFRNTYGHEYKRGNPDHNTKMGALYNQLSPDDKAHYKSIEKSDINDPQKCAERRRIANERMRSHAHQNPEYNLNIRNYHKENAQKFRRQNLAQHGPVNVRTSKDVFEPNIIFERNFATKREEDRRNLYDNFKSFHQYETKFGKEGIIDKVFTMIGITSYYCIVGKVGENGPDIKVHPAEIAVITFSLQKGVHSVESCHLKLPNESDIIDLERETSDEHLNIARKAAVLSEKVAYNFQIPECSRPGMHLKTLDQAWNWFRDQLVQNAVLICSASMHQVVHYGLQCMADDAGFTELSFFKTLKLYAIEDVTHALGQLFFRWRDHPRHDELYKPENLRDTKATFLKFCPAHNVFHSYPATDKKRHKCQIVRCLSQIQVLFDFSVGYKIGRMEQIANKNHQLCEQSYHGSKIVFPNMPLIEDTTTSYVHNIPVQDLPPLTRNEQMYLNDDFDSEHDHRNLEPERPRRTRVKWHRMYKEDQIWEDMVDSRRPLAEPFQNMTLDDFDEEELARCRCSALPADEYMDYLRQLEPTKPMTRNAANMLSNSKSGRALLELLEKQRRFLDD